MIKNLNVQSMWNCLQPQNDCGELDSVRLAMVLPIVTISKEAILLFLFLPFILSVFRNKIYYIAIALSILVFVFSRKYIDLDLNILEQLSLIEVVGSHFENLKKIKLYGC